MTKHITNHLTITGTVHTWWMQRRVRRCDHSTTCAVDTAGDRREAARQLRLARRQLRNAVQAQRQAIRDQLAAGRIIG